MIIGAHQSVAGGLHTAFERGKRDACGALQIFTKNSNMWREPAVTPEAVKAFREAHAAFGGPVMAHTSYLINLATDKADILQKSVDALVAEVERSSALGVASVVLHPGAHLGVGDDEGLKRVAEGLDEVLERTRGASALIALENTAGQGTCVGHRLEHLAEIMSRTKANDRLGVCIDTQHAFAAGYDIASEEGYDAFWSDFSKMLGLGRLKGFHLNDSKKPLGSRVDRHEHIGEGNLGLPLFHRLLNDPRFADVPAVLETEPDENQSYGKEVRLLVGLVGAAPPAPRPSFSLELAPAPAPKKKARAR